MKNGNVVWASVVVVGIIFIGTVVLVALERDVGDILSLINILAIPVLGAFGTLVYQKLDKVQEQSNGRVSELMEMVRELHTQVTALALQVNGKELHDDTQEILLRPSRSDSYSGGTQ